MFKIGNIWINLDLVTCVIDRPDHKTIRLVFDKNNMVQLEQEDRERVLQALSHVSTEIR